MKLWFLDAFFLLYFLPDNVSIAYKYFTYFWHKYSINICQIHGTKVQSFLDITKLILQKGAFQIVTDVEAKRDIFL